MGCSSVPPRQLPLFVPRQKDVITLIAWKTLSHYHAHHLSDTLSCTPPLCHIIMHTTSLSHYHAHHLSATLSCTPPLCHIIMHTTSLSHYHAHHLSVTLSCTPPLCHIIMHTTSLSHYHAHHLSATLSCTPPLCLWVPKKRSSGSWHKRWLKKLSTPGTVNRCLTNSRNDLHEVKKKVPLQIMLYNITRVH